MYPSLRDAYNRYEKAGKVTHLFIIRRDKSEIKITLDSEDVDRVKNLGSWKWNTGRGDRNYAVHAIGSAKMVALHRFVMSTPDHLTCLFRNGDTTDCRQANLLNTEWEHRGWTTKTGHAYIYCYTDRGGKDTGLFQAACYCRSEKKKKHLGYFTTVEKALSAQRKWCKKNPEYRVPGLDK